MVKTIYISTHRHQEKNDFQKYPEIIFLLTRIHDISTEIYTEILQLYSSIDKMKTILLFVIRQQFSFVRIFDKAKNISPCHGCFLMEFIAKGQGDQTSGFVSHFFILSANKHVMC